MHLTLLLFFQFWVLRCSGSPLRSSLFLQGKDGDKTLRPGRTWNRRTQGSETAFTSLFTGPGRHTCSFPACFGCNWCEAGGTEIRIDTTLHELFIPCTRTTQAAARYLGMLTGGPQDSGGSMWHEVVVQGSAVSAMPCLAKSHDSISSFEFKEVAKVRKGTSSVTW